jgi:hypothetical protein
MTRRQLGDVKFIVAHHTATSSRLSVDDVRQIHLVRGYSDIGYHFLLNESGKFFVGRPVLFRGAHTVAEKAPYEGLDLNYEGIGLALIGDFQNQDPSEKMINETAYNVKRLYHKYLEPNGVPFDCHHILPHWAASYTACPGKNTMRMIWEKLGI